MSAARTKLSDTPDELGMTPLIRAARELCLQVTDEMDSRHRVGPEHLRQLLQSGANPNVSDRNGMTPLHHVASLRRYSRYGDVMDSVYLLLAAGADRGKVDTEGRTPFAMMRAFDSKLADALATPGMRLLPSHSGETLLSRTLWDPDRFEAGHFHFEVECMKMTETIERLGLFGEMESGHVWREAVLKKDGADAVRTMVESDPELVKVRDGWGWTPLHWATLAQAYGVVRILLKAGACPNATDPSGITPLHIAANERVGGIGKLLLAAGAKPDPADNFGRTPLQRLVARPTTLDPFENFSGRLFYSGANPLVRDFDGASAFSLAFLSQSTLGLIFLKSGYREHSETLLPWLEKTEKAEWGVETYERDFREKLRLLADDSDGVPGDWHVSRYPIIWAYISRSASWWSELAWPILEQNSPNILQNRSCPESIKQALQLAGA